MELRGEGLRRGGLDVYRTLTDEAMLGTAKLSFGNGKIRWALNNFRLWTAPVSRQAHSIPGLPQKSFV